MDGSRYTEYQAISAFRQYQYWGPEEECKYWYCDINENTRTKKMMGHVQSSPYPIEIERRLKAAGVNGRRSNIEVWDTRMFHIICPGKARFVGRDEWVRRILGQVEVYGVGDVCPGFVGGTEMVQPWGFKTVEEAVASATEGMEFFMSHEVFVRPIHWVVEALSALGDLQQV